VGIRNALIDPYGSKPLITAGVSFVTIEWTSRDLFDNRATMKPHLRVGFRRRYSVRQKGRFRISDGIDTTRSNIVGLINQHEEGYAFYF
jgi:hypothetical protein